MLKGKRKTTTGRDNKFSPRFYISKLVPIFYDLLIQGQTSRKNVHKIIIKYLHHAVKTTVVDGIRG